MSLVGMDIQEHILIKLAEIEEAVCVIIRR